MPTTGTGGYPYTLQAGATIRGGRFYLCIHIYNEEHSWSIPCIGEFDTTLPTVVFTVLKRLGLFQKFHVMNFEPYDDRDNAVVFDISCDEIPLLVT